MITQEKSTYVPIQAKGLYARFFKRFLDVLLSGCALIVLSPVLLVVAILVKIKLGSPVIFCQERPGKDEKIFRMFKFRSMTDERDEDGNLLPDEVRLTKFGCLLRSTSLDELPELWNIFRGDMSIVGPRPLLVRDLVFMTSRQRVRHTVLPGLTGLAQVNGRNAIAWEDKLSYDLVYVENMSFFMDVTVIWKTVKKVLRREGISAEGMATGADLGDYLISEGKITMDEYLRGQEESRMLLLEFRGDAAD